MTPTVLIVEDDAMLAEALKDKFTRSGFVASVAKDGVEGLALAESVQPSCMILDIVMPNMHGIELLKRLRASAWGASLPVIVLTNLSAGQDVEEVKKYGVDDFYIKAHCKLDELVKRTQELSASISL